MTIPAESYGHSVILYLKGELSEDSLPTVRKDVDHHLESEEVVDVLLNVEQTPFMDSLAIEYLLDLQDRLLDRLGQVKLIKPDENIRKILEITRLEGTFEIFDDVSEAIKAIQA